MNETFRGHLEECLKHLGARFLEVFPKGSKNAARARQPVADFCGVGIDAVTAWLYHGDHMPLGEVYIKLVCFLEINRYKVIEMERMTPKRQNFARLIGFGLINAQQATEMLSYTEPSSLYKLLRDGHGATEDREQKLWDMWKIRKDKLDEAVESATQRFRLNFSGVSGSPMCIPQELLASSNTHNYSRDGVVDIMQGLLKLLDSGTLQDLTDADWAALRSSGSMILRLSSHLSTLSAKLMETN